MKKNCTECSVFSAILQRALDGNLKYLDRLILVGCLSHFQDKELILDIMKQQKNYKEEVTKQYLSKLGKSYYPVTIQYMYDLYELYDKRVDKGICCVFRYNNLPAKNVLPSYVCDYKKRVGLFQRSVDLV